MAYLSIHEPGFWLVVSLVSTISVLLLRRHAPATIQPWLLVATWVLIPYLALITGAVSPRLMGLTLLDWPATFRLGVGLALGLLVLGVIGLLMVKEEQEKWRNTKSKPNDLAGRTLAASFIIALTGAEEFNWCFLRGSVWEIALTLPQTVELPGYQAVWIAALLALPGTLWAQPAGGRRLGKAAILVITSILFFYTRNFWLCWFVHTSMWLALAGSRTSMQHASTITAQRHKVAEERRETAENS